MRKKVNIVLISFAVIMAGFIFYVFWDNNRITVAEQTVPIESLPAGLEGFSILQISDLHEKTFGENQQKLINSINAMEYDAIVFTGDMLDGIESSNYDPLYSLLEGIENKEHAFFVPGNTDPESYQVTDTVTKSAFIQGMEQRGVKLLEAIETVRKDGSFIHFTNFELSVIDHVQRIGSVNGVVTPSYNNNDKYLAYKQQLWEGMPDWENLKEEDIIIALNHYPVADPQVDHLENAPGMALRDYDLLLAGHYHGGQMRMLFYGALFVPEAWYEQSGILPPQDRVKGLWEYRNIKQYVSAGLGSSDFIPFLNFRFNNPPEINMLTLKAED